MADGMEIDTEALRAQAPKFELAADRLKRAFSQLQEVIDAEGNCWGHDEPGETFGEKYTAATTDATDGSETVAEILSRTTSDLTGTADTSEAVDQHAAANINDAGSWT
ncbi:hypothetical protein [Parasphingorhabdus pacifica]